MGRPPRDEQPPRPPGQDPAGGPPGDRPPGGRGTPGPPGEVPPARREFGDAAGGPDVGAYGPATGGRQGVGRSREPPPGPGHGQPYGGGQAYGWEGQPHGYEGYYPPVRPRDPVEEADPGPEPARTSTLLASGVAVAAALAVAAAVGALVPALVATVAAGGTALGVTLVFDDDPVRVAGGVALVLVAGGAAVAAVLAGPTPALAAVTVAAFGAASAPVQAVGGGRLSAALGVAVYGLVVPGVVGVAGILLGPLGFFAGGAVDALSAGGEVMALPGVAALALAAVWSVRTALRRLPVAELTHKDERDRTRERLANADDLLSGAVKAGVAAFAVSIVLTAGLGEYAPGVLDAVAPAFGSLVVRLPVALVTLVASLVVGATAFVRWAGGTLLARPRRTAGLAAGTALTAAVLVVSGPLLDAVLDASSAGGAKVLGDFVARFGEPVTAVMLAVVAGVVVVSALLLVPAAVGMGLAPDRALAPAVAATGLIGAAVVVAGDVPPLGGRAAPVPVVFGAVVAGLVAWDLGEYAVGVAEEVEDVAARRTELVHAAGSLGVGLAVWVGATGAHAVIQGSAADVGQPTALAGIAAAALGVVLLVVVLRG